MWHTYYVSTISIYLKKIMTFSPFCMIHLLWACLGWYWDDSPIDSRLLVKKCKVPHIWYCHSSCVCIYAHVYACRHNHYLQECTGIFDPSYHMLAHDIRLLLLRFAYEKSFSAESGGGGPQSNMYLIPYFMHVAIYVMKTYVSTLSCTT